MNKPVDPGETLKSVQLSTVSSCEVSTVQSTSERVGDGSGSGEPEDPTKNTGGGVSDNLVKREKGRDVRDEKPDSVGSDRSQDGILLNLEQGKVDDRARCIRNRQEKKRSPLASAV